MARYRVISWRGIPAQVKAWDEGSQRPRSAPLSQRWQLEIDRVAMRDGITGTDAYLAAWEQSPDREMAGSAAEVLAVVVADLEARFDEFRADPGADAGPGDLED